jgi:hypothetical protein
MHQHHHQTMKRKPNSMFLDLEDLRTLANDPNVSPKKRRRALRILQEFERTQIQMRDPIVESRDPKSIS